MQPSRRRRSGLRPRAIHQAVHERLDLRRVEPLPRRLLRRMISASIDRFVRVGGSLCNCPILANRAWALSPPERTVFVSWHAMTSASSASCPECTLPDAARTAHDRPVTLRHHRSGPPPPRAAAAVLHATPNGVKVSIMLENRPALRDRAGLVIVLRSQRQLAAGGSTGLLNLNSKFSRHPSTGPGRAAGWQVRVGRDPVTCREGGQLGIPPTRPSHEAIQWPMFQMGGIGPMFGRRLLPQVRRQDPGQTRPRSLLARNRAACRVLDSIGWRRDVDLGSDYQHRRHRRPPWVRNLIGFYGAASLITLRRPCQREARVDDRAAGVAARSEDPAQDPRTMASMSWRARSRPGAGAVARRGERPGGSVDQMVEVDFSASATKGTPPGPGTT